MSMNSAIDFITNNKLATLAGISLASIAAYGLYFVKRPQNLPPGPWGYPYIGSAREFTGDTLGDLKRLGDKYGDIFCLWTGGNRYLVVLNSYDVIKEAVISRGVEFADREPVNCLGGFDITDAIFNAHYDEQHHVTKKLVTLGTRTFLNDKIEEVLKEELSRLDQTVTEKNGKPIRIMKYLKCMTANFITQFLYAESYSYDDQEMQILMEGVERWYEVATSVTSTNCLIHPTIFATKPVSGLGATTEIRKHIESQIQAHKQTFDCNNIRNLTDLFLNINAIEEFGMEKLCNTLLMLTPDAICTATAALQWMLIYLFCFPEYKEQIEEEIKNARNSSGNDYIGLSDRRSLPLTDCFMHEVMRKQSPMQFSVLNKQALHRTLRGYNIPPCGYILANYAVVHSNPNLFPEPLQFKPERFLINGKFEMTEGFLCFGIGRRMCPGENLMRNELFLIFSNLVSRYDMSPQWTEQPDYNRPASTIISEPEDIKIVFQKKY